MTDLERRWAELRHRRVNMRRAIQHQALAPDGDLESVRMTQRMLRGTDEEFEMLSRLLGRPLPCKAIRLR